MEETEGWFTSSLLVHNISLAGLNVKQKCLSVSMQEYLTINQPQMWNAWQLYTWSYCGIQVLVSPPVTLEMFCVGPKGTSVKLSWIQPRSYCFSRYNQGCFINTIQWCLARRVPCLTTKPHYDELFAIAKAIALRCFKWGFFSLRWSGPCFGNRFLQNDDFQPADQPFQNGCQVKKMAPCSFLGWIPRCTGSKNGHAMDDLRWTVSFKPIGIH